MSSTEPGVPGGPEAGGPDQPGPAVPDGSDAATPAVDQPPRPVLHHAETVMGTVVTLDLYGPPGLADAPAYLALARARAFLHRADALFSTWKADSPMSRLRRGQLDLADAPPELYEVLASCAELRELSGGLFDPWAMPGGVDPTGYVKGWAAGRAIELLAAAGGCGAIVNAAGDVATRGVPAPGHAWRIGIADPRNPAVLATLVEVHGGAVATSGTAERGAHLVEPRSGRALARAASATVCGPDLGTADALATAFAVGGEEALAILEDLAGYEGLLIGPDGRFLHTARFPFAGDVAAPIGGPPPGAPADG